MSVTVVEVQHVWNGTMRPRAGTRQIVIHHAASTGDVDAATIHRWHLQNGWAGIGYHYVVRMGGQIERGRPEWAVGAHARDHNQDSIGICLSGNTDQRAPPTAQVSGLLGLVRAVWTRYGRIPVIRHSDVNQTACPGGYFPWAWFVTELAPRPIPKIQQRVNLVWRGRWIEGGGFLVENTSHVPVRFLAEQLGLKVRWQDGTVYVE